MGRALWPASAGTGALADLFTLDFPSADTSSPSAPRFEGEGVCDVNLDGIDDIVLRMDEVRMGEVRMGVVRAREVRVFFGHRGWGPIDVKSTPPDLVVRQGRAPWTATDTPAVATATRTVSRVTVYLPVAFRGSVPR